VIEIQGGPASGKTHLLYHLVCNCILPAAYGGWNKAAVVYDTDLAFDVRRLQHILATRVSTHPSHSCPDQVDSITTKAMRNLRLFAVSSSAELTASLLDLHTYHGDELPTSEIAILAVDSLSAFYWEDRFATEVRRPWSSWSTRSYPNPSEPTEHVHHPLHAVFVALQAVCLSHGPIVVLTNWGLQPIPEPNVSSAAPFYKQHLPLFPALSNGETAHRTSVYPKLSHRITLHRSTPAPVHLESGVPFEEACRADDAPDNPAALEIKGHVMSEENAVPSSFTFLITSQDVLADRLVVHFKDPVTLPESLGHALYVAYFF
jgi:DNA-repair protein XRCC2